MAKGIYLFIIATDRLMNASLLKTYIFDPFANLTNAQYSLVMGGKLPYLPDKPKHRG
jgi:hypothetical protein